MNAEPTDSLNPQQQPTPWPSRQKNALAAALTIATLILAILLFWYINENSRKNIPENVNNDKQSASVNASITSVEKNSLSLQINTESHLEKRTQALLDRLLGPGRSIVRVTATIDQARSETTQEIFEPETSVIRSEQHSQDQTTQAPSKGEAAASRTSTTSGRSQELINYEISKTISHTFKPSFTVRRLSASVLVDDKAIKTLSSWETQSPETEPDNNQGQQEMAVIKALVTSTLGLEHARGDSLELIALPLFKDPPPDVVPVSSTWTMSHRAQLILFLCIPLAMLALYLIMASLRRRSKKHETPPHAVSERQHGDKTASLTEDSLSRLQDNVSKDPLFSAHILRNWLNGHV